MTSTKRNRIWNDDGNRIEQGDVSGWDDDIDDDGGQGASGWGAGDGSGWGDGDGSGWGAGDDKWR